MVMTFCQFSKDLVTTGPDPAEADVPSSTDELPVQQTMFLVGELVTGQVTHHCKMWTDICTNPLTRITHSVKLIAIALHVYACM